MSDTCGTCRYWAEDKTNAQDRKMAVLDRRPCSLAKDAHDRGRFYHVTTVACRKHAFQSDGYKCG